MNLYFDTRLAEGYKSASQITRVLTENWMGAQVYCPNCGCKPIQKAANNCPVQDFLCARCDEQFELKSKNGKTAGKMINDGAYQTMIERIQADDNPNFFFLSYRKVDYSVQQLMLVPKHFMTVDMIIRRKPLPPTAKRAGWIGCTIDLSKVPESGKILLIQQQQIVAPETVRAQWQATLFLRQQQSSRKGWLLAIIKCLEQLPETFNLKQIYAFEAKLALQFPKNKYIKDKIRQQLQILRDQGVIEFSARGQYRKSKSS
ncbi:MULTISPECIES: DpnI domain-containing protein [unclassified Neisseria]|uniref:DpnI domain-containing protein n=1 Tax=unclassified Neisseria TaxID=2623750 RepID=UPI001072B196|nr:MULTISPECIES: DpnI domain-containing protein [unclassified Neisseria]MBF0802875.1 restriction endonuclease [Neisseria sp. 19428wB4_WF04]TFU44414.1 restriction endonuclease [Neisseria sp. WF04]